MSFSSIRSSTPRPSTPDLYVAQAEKASLQSCNTTFRTTNQRLHHLEIVNMRLMQRVRELQAGSRMIPRKSASVFALGTYDRELAAGTARLRSKVEALQTEKAMLEKDVEKLTAEKERAEERAEKYKQTVFKKM